MFVIGEPQTKEWKKNSLRDDVGEVGKVTLAGECELNKKYQKKKKEALERVVMSRHSAGHKPFWWEDSVWLRIQLTAAYKPFLCIQHHVSFPEYWIALCPPCAFNKEYCANNLKPELGSNNTWSSSGREV